MKHVHFIAICGTAMATLAAMLKKRGYSVRGSDDNVYPPMSTFLEREGIPILSGFKPEHITGDIDLVVVGNAVSRGNPELEEVLDRKIHYCSLPEAIRDHFLRGARSIVIAGTHGKTTMAALTGWLLTDAGLDPSVLVGGVAGNLSGEGSSYRLGLGRDFVIEGDEYDSAFFDKTAKFLKYLPDIAVVANIEFDHADIYADLDAVRLAFRRLVNIVPRRGLLVLGADSPDALALKAAAVSRVTTFGTGADADWRAYDIAPVPAGMRFRVAHGDCSLGVFEMPLVGAHNVRNALAALAVATEVGVHEDRLRTGLCAFAGVKRRFELTGTSSGVSVFDDFAHHPTAVRETLAGVRAAYPGRRVWAIFEPRSASSCRRVFQEAFADALALADETILAAVYRANLAADQRLSPELLIEALTRAGKRARYVPEIDDIVATVGREALAGDLVVCMSNGGFGGIHGKLLAALASRDDVTTAS